MSRTNQDLSNKIYERLASLLWFWIEDVSTIRRHRYPGENISDEKDMQVSDNNICSYIFVLGN